LNIGFPFLDSTNAPQHQGAYASALTRSAAAFFLGQNPIDLVIAANDQMSGFFIWTLEPLGFFRSNLAKAAETARERQVSPLVFLSEIATNAAMLLNAKLLHFE
jgi:hypothetical protein